MLAVGCPARFSAVSSLRYLASPDPLAISASIARQKPTFAQQTARAVSSLLAVGIFIRCPSVPKESSSEARSKDVQHHCGKKSNQSVFCPCLRAGDAWKSCIAVRFALDCFRDGLCAVCPFRFCFFFVRGFGHSEGWLCDSQRTKVTWPRVVQAPTEMERITTDPAPPAQASIATPAAHDHRFSTLEDKNTRICPAGRFSGQEWEGSKHPCTNRSG